MVINMNSCTFYWLKRNPQNLFVIFAAIAFMSIKGSLFADVLALLFISRTTLDIFTEMTYSLPFSRRDIWKFHVTVQAVLMMIFILVNLIQNAGNIWNILVSVFFVLFTFFCLRTEKVRCEGEKICHQGDIGSQKYTESTDCSTLFMLSGNGKTQQNTDGAEAEFKTGKHLPVPGLDVTVSTVKKAFHRQNLLFLLLYHRDHNLQTLKSKQKYL